MTDNLAIWNAVSKTNPVHTKKVNQRGGFTAINANYQIMEATRQFGPIGVGWGYINGDPIFQETLVIVPVTVWHGDRSNTFGPVFGCEEWKVKDRLDSDAPKKAGTDGLTKCLSQLGFNADVFLGLYDDQKYVDQVRREFAANQADEVDASLQLSLDGIAACDTLPLLKAWVDRNWSAVPDHHVDQIEKAIAARKTQISAMDLSRAA